MSDLTIGATTIPISFETIGQVTETVNKIVEYLGIRDQLIARMDEIDRDFSELRISRQDMVVEREKSLAFTETVVQAFMDRGQHELAVRAFESFMGSSNNYSLAVVDAIKSRYGQTT